MNFKDGCKEFIRILKLINIIKRVVFNIFLHKLLKEGKPLKKIMIDSRLAIFLPSYFLIFKQNLFETLNNIKHQGLKPSENQDHFDSA